MSFLNSALLPGLILLAGMPVIIHLLNLKFPQLFEFSSVKRIRETVAQRSRIYRWRHRILMLLRTLLLLALIFVFLKPVLPRFGSAAENTTGRTVLILIDHSVSMEHSGGGLSSRQRAISEAQKILTTLGPEDRANVMLVGQTISTAAVSFTKDYREATRFLEATKPGMGRADFSSANFAAARLLGPSAPRSEIYYLSDFQRKNWANVDFTPLPPESRLFFVEAASGDRRNRAILGAALNQAQILAGDTVTLEVEVGNFSDSELREPLKFVVDARSTFEHEITVPPWSSAKATLPIPAGRPGLHLCEISLAPDDLPADDRYFLTMEVMEKEGVLIVTDSPAPGQDAVLYLKTALNPFENQGGSLLTEQTNAAGVTPENLAGVKKVFMTRAGRLSDTSAKLLADFVFHGGGVVWFLDGDVEKENVELFSKVAGTAMPLAVHTRRVVKNVGAEAQQIIRGDFKSKFLRLFRGAGRQNLALLEFYDIYNASPAGTGEILLSYADETPAMASIDHGLGTIVLLNFSVSEFSSNLARQRIFPAWMQEIVKNLSAEEAMPAAGVIGEPVTDEVWKSELVDNAVKSPDGEAIATKVEVLGERAAISFLPDKPGFYTLRKDQRLLHAYGVNIHPDESDLRPIDREMLPERLEAGGKQGFFVQGRDDFEDLVLGKPIFHWFVYLAVGLLVIESLFQAYIKREAS